MDINTAFPSNYIAAHDLQGREIQLQIDDVKWEKIGDDKKAVVYFLGKQKGLVLNKTNATTIAEKLGYETNNWHGRTISVYPTETDYQGKRVPCIRVRMSVENTAGPITPLNPQPQPLPVQPPQAQPAHEMEPNDDIPF